MEFEHDIAQARVPARDEGRLHPFDERGKRHRQEHSAGGSCPRTINAAPTGRKSTTLQIASAIPWLPQMMHVVNGGTLVSPGVNVAINTSTNQATARSEAPRG